MLRLGTPLSPCCCAWRRMPPSMPMWTSRWTICSASSRQEAAPLVSSTMQLYCTLPLDVLPASVWLPNSAGILHTACANGCMLSPCAHCLTSEPCSALHGVCLHISKSHVLQDKLQRTQILECIVLCTELYLRRSLQQRPEAAADPWLAKTTKPVIASLRKGNFQFQEQQVLRWHHGIIA